MPKFSAYMRGEGVKGDPGPAANFGQFFATAHSSISPEVTVTTSGDNTEKNVYFDFGLQPGIAGGFSTVQQGVITELNPSESPYVTITTDTNSPNSEKVFNFNFGIPKLIEIKNIEQEVISTTSGGDNIIKITLSDNSTTTFNIKNGIQGNPSIIDGSVLSVEDLPKNDNYLGRGFLVGQTTKNLYIYLEENNTKHWINQGTINFANFGTPITESYSIPSTSDPIVEVIPIDESPNTEKVFNFKFGIPKGEVPIIGITTSITTLTPYEEPKASITNLSENNFKIDFGIPYPEVKASASTITLFPFQEAQVTTSFSNNNIHFDFKIPKGDRGDTGSQGLEGYGFYQKMIFTSTNIEESNFYEWIEENTGTSTLIIDRTENEYIPINIYNSNNNNIAATFTLGISTENYPFGTIKYETKEKFDGILYYIGKAPTPQLKIGDVATGETTESTVTIRKDGYDSILDFIIPSSGPRGYTGNGIESISLSTIDGLTTKYQINLDNGDNYDFNIVNGRGIESIILDNNDEINRINNYIINYNDGTTTEFQIKDGLAATIDFNSNVFIDRTLSKPKVENSGNNTAAYLTFSFPPSLTYTVTTVDIEENSPLNNGIFYFVYEENEDE